MTTFLTLLFAVVSRFERSISFSFFTRTDR